MEENNYRKVEKKKNDSQMRNLSSREQPCLDVRDREGNRTCKAALLHHRLEFGDGLKSTKNPMVRPGVSKKKKTGGRRKNEGQRGKRGKNSSISKCLAQV